MKRQVYYNYPFESAANVCLDTVDIAVNCAGIVDETVDVDTCSVRRDYYLMYVTKGSMLMELENKSDIISSGQLLIISPGTRYHYRLDGNSRVNYMWVHFTGRCAAGMLERFGIPAGSICNVGVHHSFSELWQRLFGEFVRNDGYFAEVAGCILTEMLVAFSRYIHASAHQKNFVRSVTYIHQNYSEDISVAQLAAMENMSEPHYRVCFRKAVGVSPVEYITNVRIRSAVQLLEETDKKLAEISRLCGYNDVYYFIRVFKKKIGVTPGRYRSV